MRVLLDEHLPLALGAELVGHEVSSVRDQGWKGLKNGILCARAAAAGFDVLLTNDGSMEHQINQSTLRLGIVVLDAVSNKFGHLLERVPAALEAISTVVPGEVRHVAG